ERNRIRLAGARLTTGESSVEFSGTLEDLNSPRATFQYRAHVSLLDVDRTVHVPELQRGTVDATGSGTWSSAAGPVLSGEWHAYGVAYRDSTLRLQDGRADGRFKASAEMIEATGMRLSAAYLNGAKRVPVDGRIATAVLRGRNLDFR